MTELYFSRARLRSDCSVGALAGILKESHDRMAAKALIWTLFGDDADRRRDFLWCRQRLSESSAPAEGRLSPRLGEFLILSRRPPVDRHNLFQLEIQDYAPRLATGDRLGFRLHANPVLRRKSGDAGSPGKVKRVDVVMDALHRLPPGIDRAAERFEAIQVEGAKWLRRQFERAGAALIDDALRIDGYEQVLIPKANGTNTTFSVLDFDGALVVADPERLLAAIVSGLDSTRGSSESDSAQASPGFGSARAYGCGLLLLRRL